MAENEAGEGIGDDAVGLLDLLEVLAEHLRLLLLGPVCMALLVWGVAWIWPPTFTARTVVLPPQQASGANASLLASLGPLGGVAGMAAGLKTPADQHVAYLKSKAVKDELIDRFDLVSHFGVAYREDVRRILESQTRISAGKEGLLVIEVDHRSAALAADLANAHVQAWQHVLARLAVVEAQQRRQFFEKHLQQSQQALQTAQAELQRTGVSEAVLKSSPASAAAAVSVLRAQITALETRLGVMRAYLAETAPDFKLALQELSGLRQQLSKLESGQMAATVGGPDQYMDRYRDFKYHEALYELFSKQYEMARIDEAREGPVLQVLDWATPPERPAKPQKLLLAALAGLSTAIVLLMGVFLRQAWTRARQDPNTAERWRRLAHMWRRAWGRR